MRALLFPLIVFSILTGNIAQAQVVKVSTIDHRDVGNYNFLDGRFFGGDSFIHEILFYDKLISFKIFFGNSNSIWFQFLRIDDTSFLETRYSPEKMEERVRYVISDSIFSVDTIPMLDFEGNFIRDTIIYDTLINLVKDGGAKYFYPLGYSLLQQYRMGEKLHKEFYQNEELSYIMWSTGYDSKNDTLFYNQLLNSSEKKLKEILCAKQWLAGGYTSAENFFNFNEISEFNTDWGFGNFSLRFTGNGMGNKLSISQRSVDSEQIVEGGWGIYGDTHHLIIQLEKIRLKFLILYLDDQRMILKLLTTIQK